MKKTLKIFFLFLVSFIILGLTKCVSANSINKLSMDIYVDKNGDASITETWKCYASKGTEIYHPYYNLGNSEIVNLSVSEAGNNYQSLSSWNTSGSLESKANKCGINTISNGVELCWGISQYGSHTYTIKYTITKFVSSLTDSQMIYWTLIPNNFSNPIDKTYVKIHSDSKIPNSVGVWGYGDYGGTAYVYDGYIEMQSNGSLSSSEYMTILVQFPTGTFNTTNFLNNDFYYYHQMAEKGSIKYQGSNSSTKNVNSSASASEIAAFVLTIPFLIIFFLLNSLSTSKSEKKLDFGSEGNNIPKDVNYFRDIPCKKEIFRAYYIAYNYKLVKNKSDLLGAIILKWIKESKIRIEQKEVGKIFKKEDTVIILNDTNPDEIENSKEKLIFNMLYEASKDGILENKEFEKWCSKSYSKILTWFDDILIKEKNKLVQEGLITVEDKVIMKIFKYKKYTPTSSLRQEALQLAGLKRYLLEYTLISEREAIEVTLFEEYLIYAQIMGISKKVAKEFKELYPKMIEESKFNSFDNLLFINLCVSNGISSANTAKTRAESYSSGGGGFSSGGGGGGSFGRWRRWWRWLPLKLINCRCNNYIF